MERPARVLDVMLPGRDGYALLPAVRATAAGVILLTARTGVADRVRGLRGGADDYLVKPFALAELLARVEALLRRSGGVGDAVEVADLVADPGPRRRDPRTPGDAARARRPPRRPPRRRPADPGALRRGPAPGARPVDLVELVRVETDRDAVRHPDDPAVLDAGGPVPVSVDAELIGQALTNLLTNARRHGNGAVTVTVGADDSGTAQVAVRDEGPGVPVEERERVFGRMVRLDEARGRGGGGGAGLGLAIAREAARAHGGDLVCTAPEDGGPGAVFVLTLPVA